MLCCLNVLANRSQNIQVRLNCHFAHHGHLLMLFTPRCLFIDCILQSTLAILSAPAFAMPESSSEVLGLRGGMQGDGNVIDATDGAKLPTPNPAPLKKGRADFPHPEFALLPSGGFTPFTITINEGGRKFPLKTCAKEIVISMKQAIMAHHGFATELQQLYFVETLLEDLRSVQDYNIQDKSELKLVMHDPEDDSTVDAPASPGSSPSKGAEVSSGEDGSPGSSSSKGADGSLDAAEEEEKVIETLTCVYLRLLAFTCVYLRLLAPDRLFLELWSPGTSRSWHLGNALLRNKPSYFKGLRTTSNR
jgi:hypothetical protein